MKNCNIAKNARDCNCTYPCEKKGLCCECIAYHRGTGQLPACYFSAADEKSYDRSIEKYLQSRRK